MIGYLAEMFGGSLALTLITELSVLFLFLRFSHRQIATESGTSGQLTDGCTRSEPISPKNDLPEVRPCGSDLLLLVVLVNVLTNPPAVLLCWLGRLFLPQGFSLPVQLVVEIMVVFTEASVCRSFAGKPQWRLERPVAFSVTANLCSWLLGAVLSL